MINTERVVATSPITLKNAIDKIARNAFQLTNASGKETSTTGGIFMTSVPTVSDLEEGSAVFTVIAGAYKIYFKVNNQIKFIALS